MHGSLVTSSLLAETHGDVSLNTGYLFGQEDETYTISGAHGYFGRLIFQYAIECFMQAIVFNQVIMLANIRQS